jgi:ABC-type Fe3+-hydroxamate transport system substrate-binding protein
LSKRAPEPEPENTEAKAETLAKAYESRRAKLNYKTRTRAAGSGPIRVGTYMSLGEDIWSIFYVSTMHPDYIYYFT